MFGIQPELFLIYLAGGLAALGVILSVLFGLSLLPFLQQTIDSKNTSDAPGNFLRARGQGATYDSLCRLGFEFVGSSRESCAFVGTVDQVMLVHSELPITCSLSQSSSDKISTSFYSDDGGERFLVTTNHDILESDYDGPSLFLHVDPVSNVEELLRSHVGSLEIWEDDGFEAKHASNFDETKSQSKRFQNHPVFKKKLRDTAVLIPIGIGMFHVGAPALVGWGALHFLSFTPWPISIQVAITLVAALSSLVSLYLLYSLFRVPSGKKGVPHKARRITKQLRSPVASIGFTNFDFKNKAWASRIKKHRWAIVLGGVLLFILLNPFLVLPVLFLLLTTRAKRIFAFRCLVTVNDQFVTRKRFTFFGESNVVSYHLCDQKLFFKDIEMLRLEPGPLNSIKLIAEYSYAPPRSLFHEIGLKSAGEKVRESSLVLVDSLCGFETDKVRELLELIRQKRKLVIGEFS